MDTKIIKFRDLEIGHRVIMDDGKAARVTDIKPMWRGHSEIKIQRHGFSLVRNSDKIEIEA